MSRNQLTNYTTVLNELKEKIRQARTRAALSVNKELLQTYWEIGCTILQQQKLEGWGTKVIDRLANDLRTEFPDFQGLSVRNFKYMRAFAEAYPGFPNVQAPPAHLTHSNDQSLNAPIVQAPLAQLTWYHHTSLLDKVKDLPIRLFYILKTIENGWSRNVMVHQIESGLHLRQGALTTNFKTTIAPEQSELLQQIFKDPYNLDFLQMAEKARERDLENAIIQHMTRFLLELGDGFAFVGRQYGLNVGEKEYFIDLLFYHTKLRRYIVIDLKIGEFEPEFTGKMNFYLSVADDTLKGKYDESSIGLILCKTKDKVTAEYALLDTNKPIGISEYRIWELLPENIKGELPSIEELEQKLDEELKQNVNPLDLRLQAIKERLRNITAEEIQTPVTYPLLVNLYHKSLRPLFIQLIEKFSEVNELFHIHRIGWYYANKYIEDFQQLDELWNDETQLRQGRELFFDYQLSAFKKAGTENFSAQFRLQIEVDTYWYGFSFSNEQPFIKKLYHQSLTDQDQVTIIDSAGIKLLDQVDWIVERIQLKN